ncbi:MAG: hypothetical protein DYH14_00195 [Betaproteobacteria bacterium PRO3]|nr:hypothetical protein [Betaproteobacteria bacterium PRO3]
MASRCCARRTPSRRARTSRRSRRARRARRTRARSRRWRRSAMRSSRASAPIPRSRCCGGASRKARRSCRPPVARPST